MSDIIEVFPAAHGLTSPQVSQAIALLKAGGSYSAVARQLATTHQRISRIAAQFGVETSSARRARTERIRAEAADFRQDRRLDDLNLLAKQVRAKLESDETTAKDLRDLAVALGVAIDKRRLEEGQSTSNQASTVRVWSARSVTPAQPEGQS